MTPSYLPMLQASKRGSIVDPEKTALQRGVIRSAQAALDESELVGGSASRLIGPGSLMDKRKLEKIELDIEQEARDRRKRTARAEPLSTELIAQTHDNAAQSDAAQTAQPIFIGVPRPSTPLLGSS